MFALINDYGYESYTQPQTNCVFFQESEQVIPWKILPNCGPLQVNYNVTFSTDSIYGDYAY